MALAVLCQGRSFPNAIVLATDNTTLVPAGLRLDVPDEVRFLVVDGQHRLWAQHYTDRDAPYACVIHTGLSEVEMARLFLEINDNQKRVPSSLRWDLMRLVQPDEDPIATKTAELVYQLATDPDSPLFQRIDLTGEQSEIQLKQGSLAPEIRGLLTRRSVFRDLAFEQQYLVIRTFCQAVRDLDRSHSDRTLSVLSRARVLRALLRLLPEMLERIQWTGSWLAPEAFRPFLSCIDFGVLSDDQIRAAQGNAGIGAIHNLMRRQMLSQP